MKSLIAGNWKMNFDRAKVEAFADQLSLGDGYDADKAELLLCAPHVYLALLADKLAGQGVYIGGQDCSDHQSGAYTGQVSAAMLGDVGCSYVIVGHSERRDYNGENSRYVQSKAEQALAQGLVPIICVGETEFQREGGEAFAIVEEQVIGSTPVKLQADQEIVVAYEPVWAIGTGKVASEDDVAQMHAHIYQVLETKYGAPTADTIRILYGGSMKPDNARGLLSLPYVHGGLIGGASLDVKSFLAIASLV